MNYIACKDVAFAYDGQTVLSGVNFEIAPGDYLCIVGENGAGKSTLVKGLLGLKAACAGEIERSAGLNADEIGYLPQQTAAQKDFPASAYEVALSGCLNALGARAFYTRAMKKRALDSLDELGVLPLKHRCYRELSGGQQQRVLLARALCATKKLLLLDEPVAGLDPVVTHDLYERIKALNEGRGIAVVMVSHDVKSAVRYAKTMLHISGEQQFFGATGDYITSAVGQKFLGEVKADD